MNIHLFANDVDRCNEIDWFGVCVHILRRIYVLASRVIRLALKHSIQAVHNDCGTISLRHSA